MVVGACGLVVGGSFFGRFVRTWGRSVAELIGCRGDRILPRFRLARTVPYFLQDSLYRGGQSLYKLQWMISIMPLGVSRPALYKEATRAYKAVPILTLI
jgi:hypothetical protein